MPQNVSLQELQRRVDKDPASIAFARLAEEYRRAGMYEEAVRVARAGLTQHPGYLSARVTLGRALVELDQLDAAKIELDTVLRSAPDNLAAIRALAEIHQRRGDTPEPPPIPETPPARPTAPEPAVESVAPAPEPVPESVPPDVLPPTLDALPDAREPAHALDLDLQEFNTALEALTLDLPASERAPVAEEFDLAAFRVDEARQNAEPGADWNLDGLESMPARSVPVKASAVEPPRVEPPPIEGEPVDPVLAELEQWLGALFADRADRKGR